MAVASYDQLANQVEALRKENTHLRRELEDNSQHLNKLENDTEDMKEVLKQLQCKLEQEAGTLASSGRTDVLDQLKELHMDLTNYYELKYQPHNLRCLPESLGGGGGAWGGPGPGGTGLGGGGGESGEERLALASRLRPLHHGASPSPATAAAILSPHIMDGAPPKAAFLFSGHGDGPISEQHLDELYKERNMLLSEIDREERERCWYYTQLQALSQRLGQLPRIDTFSLQMDLIRQQLEFEAQQVHSVMEERFGTSDEMVHRTQMRVSRLEQLDKELQEAQEARSNHDNSMCQLQISAAATPSAGDSENASSAATGLETAGDGGSKVEMVFWLLSMLANRDKEDMSRTLLAMSSSQDSCVAMRKSGCVPLLVQILHDAPGGAGEAGGGTGGAGGCSREAKSRAAAALHNVVFAQADEGQGRREMRTLHLLEQIRSHCDSGWDWMESQGSAAALGTPSQGPPAGTTTTTTDIPEPVDPQICQAMCAVMKLSFEEEYRRAMNELGGMHVVADLLHLDQQTYGLQKDPINLALRRYAGMTLTNLTFGDVVNKATLCSKKACLAALVSQLSSDSEELHQVVSSILRNLSWRADINSKRVLRDIGSVAALITCALQATKESTLKSLLSALWNLSAHSIENKVSICSVEGALGFLVSTLTYRCQTNSLAIIESGGGILRNVSSLIATREDYRQVLRDHNCLQTLLGHLRSHSLTIVSNACGTLWNLSARSPRDQELLWDLGAVAMLRNLIHSKHKMIAMGSAAALRNLLANRPPRYKDAAVISPGSCAPSLYVRKQRALEAELDARHLAETFDSLNNKQQNHQSPSRSLQSLQSSKPQLLRHTQIESLAKDYASDSGCFDDDEAPNVSSSLDNTGSFSMLSMFLTNSNFLNNQPRKKDNSEPERDVEPHHQTAVERRHAPHGHAHAAANDHEDVSAAAEKLAKKITSTVAKIDRLVEDITMHTSSTEDSFSLSSEDPFADWPHGPTELTEARAKSCSPCRLSDTSSMAHRERLSRAHALIRLKTAQTSLSTDSLNSGSTSDGYCGSRDQLRPPSDGYCGSREAPRPPSDGYCGSRDQLRPPSAAAKADPSRKRPNQLDLKVANQEYLTAGGVPGPHDGRQTTMEVPERDSVDNNKEPLLPELGSDDDDVEKNQQEALLQTPVSVVTKVSSDVSMASIKLSPSYQHVPLIQSVAKFGVAKTAINVQAAQAMRRQAWVPTVMTGGSITKFSPMSAAARSPTAAAAAAAMGPMETLQKYSVENTPICFSRCSSLSSLSSGDGALDGQSQSENELESDSSLEIIEVEEGEEVARRAEEDETLEDLSDSQLLVTDSKTFPSKEATEPIQIPCSSKRDKVFLRGASPAVPEDRSPSSSSENYVHETPLVMSRCSSVSSLGSFEAPSIASSIQSDPCSEMMDGTISPSDLPDSPGQTMPPSRSKTPCCMEPNGAALEAQSSAAAAMAATAGQWETNLRKFMEITDFKERFNLPQDLDTMIYFTVEKPTENFSCASSLSALPLHEHYIQKDVELKLTPLLQQSDRNPEEEEEGEERATDHGERYSEGNSDDDIEILKECINSAMPSKFRKVRPSLVTNIPSHLLSAQNGKSIQLPVYMMLPNGGTQIVPGRKFIIPQKEFHFDDSSFTDSAEGTPVNFSSTTSLSDETLQYPVKEKGGAKDWRARNAANKPDVDDDEAKRIEDLRIFSHFHKPVRMTTSCQPTGRTTKHVIPTQRVLMQSKEVADRVASQRHREQSPGHQRQRREVAARKLELPVIKQEGTQNNGSLQGNRIFQPMQHQSPTEEEIYCFYDDQKEKRAGRKQAREASRNSLSRSMTNIGRMDNSQPKAKGFHRIKQNLIKSDAPTCYSLSTSLSSLSDAEFDDHKSATQQMWAKNRHNKSHGPPQQQQQAKPVHIQYEEQSSPSSVSMDSEDDLLQRCITSAMPRHSRKKVPARKKKADKAQKQKKNWQKSSDGWNVDQGFDSDDAASDKDSDLNSVEWRAIQEGANSVVTELQASKSQEPSSEETESVLSFMSTSSFTPKERKFAKDKKANKPLDFDKRKPVPNMPVVFRGRTVTYTPKKETTNLSQRPPKKTGSPKNPELAQHRSKSLHRLSRPQDMELSLPKRSSTPPPRIPKSSSSGSSQSSTPSKQSQRRICSPTRSRNIPKKSPTPSSSPPASSPPERKGRSPVMSQSPRSPVKTQKSPVRIPFMQTSARQPRTLSPLVTNQPTSVSVRQTAQVVGKRMVPTNRFDLVRMTSVHSSSSSGESDRNGFLRQLTFIKESKSMMGRRGDSPGRPGATGPGGQRGSPRRVPPPPAAAVFLCSSRCQELKAAVQGPRKAMQAKGPPGGQRGASVQPQGRPPQPQSRGQDPGLQKQTSTLARASSSERDLSSRRPARRTSSESPCRVAQRGGGGSGMVAGGRAAAARQQRQQQQQDFKRHASSPSINVLSRVTSRSSLRSSSSDSSGRAKSEDDTKKKKGQRSGSRITWRRIKDEDVPQILRSTLPESALPLAPSPEADEDRALPDSALPLAPPPEAHEDRPQPATPAPPLGKKLPTIVIASRKTSDATVQTEDPECDGGSNKTTNSSTSPDPIVASSEEEATAAKLLLLRKIGAPSGNPHDGGDADASTRTYAAASTTTNSTSTSTSTSESQTGGGGGGGAVTFRQGGSPSKAARVTPFNYTPSPMATTCCLQEAQAHSQSQNQSQAVSQKTLEQTES